MPLRSLYEYVSSLTRPIRYMEETRGGESCAADRDATNLVPIRRCPNPPGDDIRWKPGVGSEYTTSCLRLFLSSV